jgi:hypothetical protein
MSNNISLGSTKIRPATFQELDLIKQLMEEQGKIIEDLNVKLSDCSLSPEPQVATEAEKTPPMSYLVRELTNLKGGIVNHNNILINLVSRLQV